MQTHTAASSNETHADVYSCLYPTDPCRRTQQPLAMRPMQMYIAASTHQDPCRRIQQPLAMKPIQMHMAAGLPLLRFSWL